MRNAPQVLCIQLLRFDANGQKINQEVDYPPELTVPNYQDGSETSTTKYNLSSIIVHEGNQISSGHYVCYVNRSGRWFNTSDTVVKEASQLATYHQTAYMLFYKKVQQKKMLCRARPVERIRSQKKLQQHLQRITNTLQISTLVGIQTLPKGFVCLYRRNARLFLHRSPRQRLLAVQQTAFLL